MESDSHSRVRAEDPEVTELNGIIEGLLSDYVTADRRRPFEQKIVNFTIEKTKKALQTLKTSTKEVKRVFLQLKCLETLCIKVLDELAKTREEVKTALKQLLSDSKPADNLTSNAVKAENCTKLDTSTIKIALSAKDKPFPDKVLTLLLVLLNNLAVLMATKSKSLKPLQAIFKAIDIRKEHLEYIDGFFSLAVLFLNVGYLLMQTGEQNEANLVVNKAILILEDIDKFVNTRTFLGEASQCSLCLLQLEELPSLNPPYEDDRIQFVEILRFSYKFYAKILDSLGKKEEANFAREHAEYLKKKQEKLLLSSNRPESASKQQHHQDDVNFSDNLSSASFKTTSFYTTDTYLSNLKKKNIIFQKYIEVSEVKYKIIMLELPELKSLQILVYNKPAGFLRKIFLFYQDFMDFAKKVAPKTFESEKGLEKFLLRIASMLYIKDNELFIKELRSFRTIEEVLQSLNSA